MNKFLLYSENELITSKIINYFINYEYYLYDNIETINEFIKKSNPTNLIYIVEKFDNYQISLINLCNQFNIHFTCISYDNIYLNQYQYLFIKFNNNCNDIIIDLIINNSIGLFNLDCIINNKIKFINKCLCCKEPNNELLNLGYQPLANDFHKENEINEIYPLKLMCCYNCYHCQLSHIVDPEILFKNYKYVSGTSQTGLNFFKQNAEFIVNYKGYANGNILDIACNDGTQLDYFKQLGWNTYGVDPAENLYNVSSSKGHKIICDFWNNDIALKLPKMDVITAQNVFAHTEYIDDFLQACKIIMNNDSSLFIQTSQRDMIINNEFDTIYHEHISFFNVKSMDTLTKRNNLVLNRVLENDIHGRSYIFEIKLIKDDSIFDVNKHLDIEYNLGLYNISLYNKFNNNAKQIIINLKNEINKYNIKCIGFGASAKGQTLLCYGNILLDYIIDDNPLKIGTYSPKLNIPIVSLDHFINDKNDKYLIIILAWNFAKEIKNKIINNMMNKQVILIERYFPNIITTIL